MIIPDEHILVIFGASGDLTKRKLLPSLLNLFYNDLLPENFAVLGIGRTKMNDESFRLKMNAELKSLAFKSELKNRKINTFIDKLCYLSLNTKDPNDFSNLKSKLGTMEKNHGIKANYIFYLATPPSIYETIAEGLALFNLNREDNNFWRRIIIEKPFGYDLSSARILNFNLLSVFNEDQVYRIDHYLGKETVQNVMVTRFSNGIFEPLWNRNYIHHIEITSAESLGVEMRGGYYDSSGALRDMVQNHLLHVAALIAMEPPAVNTPNAIRNETLKVFQALKTYRSREMNSHVILGQYTSSEIQGKKVSAYRDEPGVNPDSRTETYAALKMYIENWRWGGVPFYIRTGKRLPARVTEVVIHFRPAPHKLFCYDKINRNHDNQLIIRIQPDEGILFKIGMKVPGTGFKVQNVNMDFHYSDLTEQELPEAYQRLLLDCMNGDATLYARGDAVEEAWKFIDPILQYTTDDPGNILYGYPSGSWGPSVADDLIEGSKLTWRYPCKNLISDGVYCEL